MVALEAMACGVPVVASDQPGFRFLLREGGGILVDDPTDTESLAEAILMLLRDEELACALGRQGQRVARQYTIERSAQDFIATMQRFLRKT
jgi:glycosyltransferase involved in cell wall biosynthesis